jgi:hypothetical protein
LIIDRSGSMSVCDGPGIPSRWRMAGEAVAHLAEFVTKADPEGVRSITWISHST